MRLGATDCGLLLRRILRRPGAACCQIEVCIARLKVVLRCHERRVTEPARDDVGRESLAPVRRAAGPQVVEQPGGRVWTGTFSGAAIFAPDAACSRVRDRGSHHNTCSARRSDIGH